MATWPSYLKILHDGYGENPEPAVLRTDMESGPPKQVRIKSRTMIARPMVVSIETAANYAAWLTWFRVTINHGTDWFDFADPRTGSIVPARIQSGLYTAEHMTRMRAWRLHMTLETWE